MTPNPRFEWTSYSWPHSTEAYFTFRAANYRMPLNLNVRRRIHMAVDLIIREAVLADSDALFETHKDSVKSLCAGAYSKAHLAVWFEGRSPEIYRPAIEAHQIWLAEHHGRVLGFVGYVPGEVTLLFVRKEAAGLGLGKRLFATGLAKAEAGFSGPLTVVATQNAQRFYQAHGFVPIERQAFVRGEPEIHFEVVIMQRILAVDR